MQIVTGDTKVVERGHGDGCYINTAGMGVLREGIAVGPHRAQPGDAILVSGTIGDHGMAIMSVREGLEFESQIRSDCAALNGMIAAVLDAAGADVHAMRDPTRGGLASTLNEIAQLPAWALRSTSGLPVRTEVQSACELLGLDPVYVANEGKAVFFVREAADAVLAVLKAHPLGREAPALARYSGAQGHAGGAHRDGRESGDPHADRRAVAAHLLTPNLAERPCPAPGILHTIYDRVVPAPRGKQSRLRSHAMRRVIGLRLMALCATVSGQVAKTPPVEVRLVPTSEN